MEESSRLVDTGILIAVGGAIGHFFSWLLRFLKLRVEKDSMLVDKTLQYSDALRKDIDEMKTELGELRKENSELQDQVRELAAKLELMYIRNNELLQMDRSHREHIEQCVVAQRMAMEGKGDA